MGNMKKVEIYTTPSCPYCHLAKEYFESKGISYEEYDVSKDIARREEMVKQTGMMAVPVVRIGGKVIVGFNKTKINELLGLG